MSGAKLCQFRNPHRGPNRVPLCLERRESTTHGACDDFCLPRHAPNFRCHKFWDGSAPDEFPYGLHAKCPGHPTEVEALRCSDGRLRRLISAARALYYAAVWDPDRPVDAAGLWGELRDATGFTQGRSPKRLRPPDSEVLAELRQENAENAAAVATLRHHFGLHRTEMNTMRDLLSRKQDEIARLRGLLALLRSEVNATLETLDKRRAQGQEFVDHLRDSERIWKDRAERAEALLAQAVTGVQFGMPAFPQKYDDDPLGLGRCG